MQMRNDFELLGGIVPYSVGVHELVQASRELLGWSTSASRSRADNRPTRPAYCAVTCATLELVRTEDWSGMTPFESAASSTH